MSKQLYEEALADVKKLKEIAEDNAKKALIEAVSPRIKDLIESELLREVEEAEATADDDLLLDDGLGMQSSMNAPVSSHEASGVQVALSAPDEEGKVTLDLDALAAAPSEFEVSDESMGFLGPVVDKMQTSMATRVESKLFQLGESVENLLEADLKTKKSISFQQKVEEMVSEIEKTYEYLQESAGDLQGKSAYEGKLETLYRKLNKLVEQENMKKKLDALTEAELVLKLTNVPDDLEDALEDLNVELVAGGEEEESEEGGEELDLGGEEEEKEEEKAEEAHAMESKRLSDNLVVEIDENMLRREIARMRTLREAADDVQSWGHGPGEVSDEFADEDMGDPFVDVDLTLEADDEKQEEGDDSKEEGMHEVDEMSMEMDEMYEIDELDQEEQKEEAQVKQAKDSQKSHGERDEAQSQKQNRMPEADQQDKSDEQEEAQQVQEARRRLAREARIQTEAKKKAKVAKEKSAAAKKKAKMKEQQAQAAAKKKQAASAKKHAAEARKCEAVARQADTAYAYYANIFNESVRRADKLQSVLAESHDEVRRNGASTRSTEETSTLRKKLAETNLFNTKLLYSNKLLQNESLTKRQKAEIIERLDEAASEREVKLVYESLVKALVGGARPMVESAQRRVLGSSSQATRPASTVLSESYEADRWAKLAGLK